MIALEKDLSYQRRIVIGDAASVAGYDHQCRIGSGGIEFNSAVLASFNLTSWEPVFYDSMLVAAAIEYCDRKVRRRLGIWTRDFEVSIPVHEPGRWNDATVKSALEAVLKYLTGDKWSIHFRQLVPSIEGPASLDLSRKYDHVMAYSDGVDSRCVAGLYRQDELVRVRVGTPDKVRRRREPFTAIPFKVKVDNAREESARSRGFKFAIVAGLAAYVCKSDKIVVPESGQGALGPVMAGLSRVYPDYRNYPLFFRKMEKFLKGLFGRDIAFVQPRLWFTKGQTIREYLQQPDVRESALNDTRSCWQTRFNVRHQKRLRQCGLCAACLLRRLSLHAAGVSEPTGTYVWENLKAASYEDATPEDFSPTNSMIEFGIAGAQHLEQFSRLRDLDFNDQLSGYAEELAFAVGEQPKATHEELRTLISTHASEWRSFKSDLGAQSFIRAWSGERS